MRHSAAALIGILALGLVAGCGAGSDPDVTQSPTAAAADPTSPPPAPPVSAGVAAGLVGLPVAEAQTRVAAAGLTWRVVSVDGVPQPATMDYREDRINVEVNNDVVVAAAVG